MDTILARKEKRREISKRYYRRHKERCLEYCKKYHAEHAQERREYWIKHAEEKRESDKRYREEHAEELREYFRKHRVEHAEEIHAYRAEHAEEKHEYNHKYRTEHPEYFREKDRERGPRRRAQKLAIIGGHFTEKEWQELLDRTGHKCLCCGATDVPLQRDHVIPLVLGMPHSDEITNIQPLCKNCNSSKHTKTINYTEGME